MAKNIVYFDLETQRTANDVGGWGNVDQMMMSVGVTYSTEEGRYMVYAEHTVDRLVEELVHADLVVGYNHIWFDYRVLMAYTIRDLPEQVSSLDIMREIVERSGGDRPKLDDVAKATIGASKTAMGLDAIQWWQQGKVMDIARYCCFDVKVTRLVYEHGAREGYICYPDRTGQIKELKVEWEAP
jgi:hypothetical protein